MDDKIGLQRNDLPKTTWPLKSQNKHSNTGLLTLSLEFVSIVLVD